MSGGGVRDQCQLLTQAKYGNREECDIIDFLSNLSFFYAMPHFGQSPQHSLRRTDFVLHHRPETIGQRPLLANIPNELSRCCLI